LGSGLKIFTKKLTYHTLKRLSYQQFELNSRLCKWVNCLHTESIFIDKLCCWINHIFL